MALSNNVLTNMFENIFLTVFLCKTNISKPEYTIDKFSKKMLVKTFLFITLYITINDFFMLFCILPLKITV